MANDHGEQIRIVQETVAGKEITFAHVMGGPSPNRFRYCGQERKCLSRICGPLYGNTDYNWRDFGCNNGIDGDCGIFP